VGARISHDASAFYARFRPREVSTDDTVAAPFELAEPLVCGDARHMDLPDNSVALVVTSPPYYAGKEYEEARGQGVIPATYIEYLQLLRDVFAECRRVLEPGGRIAVNVANLGRKPYRSLAADVIRILDDDLGLLLRGEIIWQKAEGASGSCAWGSYRSPTNPVLRDVTERVVVASKGRFDRALDVHKRRAAGLPHRPTISTDEFLDATLDVWRMRPESARRVHHPAPFPVELPQRLIELYTFEDDLVVDPFVGSGTTAVAALRTGRRYAGYDTDHGYVQRARLRLAHEREVHDAPAAPVIPLCEPGTAAIRSGGATGGRAVGASEGKAAAAHAADLLEEAGFTIARRDLKVPGLGLQVGLVGSAADGESWYFDVTGAFTSTPGGLLRSEVLWRALGRASVLAASGVRPVVLLSSHLPPRRSAGDRALRRLGPRSVHDVMGMAHETDRQRLARYAAGGHHQRPLPGFWTEADLDVLSTDAARR
jgi:site-specific DNA-methyltransferase (adenine-specific)